MNSDEFEPWRARMKDAFERRKDIEKKAFSEEIGKNKDYVNRMINVGTANPSPALLQAICDKLGVASSWILTGDDTEQERSRILRRVMDADAATVRRISRVLDLMEEDT